MRLLTVGSLPPEWGGPLRGGAATFHAALLSELGRRRDVEAVGVLPPGPLDREGTVPAWPRPEETGRASHYEQLLERLRPDAVLMNHIANTVGVTHARLDSPPPAVGVVHSWHNVTRSSGEERRRALEVTQEALGGLEAMVAVSGHMLVEGGGLGLTFPAIVETIHNPVPPLYMDDVEVTASDRSGALFLGSLIPRKRPGALVEAAAGMQALDVLLVGAGELEAELRERIAALGIGDRVRLAAPPAREGHLPWIRDALSRAEVMCLPSASEGLPLAFVEALACGTPIVGFAPAVSEMRNELGIEVGEPLAGDEPEEIAAAIERVRSRKWDRRELRRATLQAFGLDRVADRYIELLKRVAVEGGGVARQMARPADAAPSRRASQVSATPVCVLGPSRSGTSLTARLLELAGVDLGPEAELLGEERHQLAAEGEEVLAKAAYSNPGGHYEHYRLMRLNERILRTLGGSWREPPPLPDGWEGSDELAPLREEAREILAESFAGHELWGWKDPRNSLTLPFWQTLLPEIRCVICFRHPLEVAESLRERDGIEPERGIEQWTRYLAAALVNSSGRPRLLVRYEDYFHRPEEAAGRLAIFVGRPGAFDGPAGDRPLSEVVDAGLWRHRHPAERPGDALPAGAAALLRVAELLALTDTAGDGGAELNAAADCFARRILSQLTAPLELAP